MTNTLLMCSVLMSRPKDILRPTSTSNTSPLAKDSKGLNTSGNRTQLEYQLKVLRQILQETILIYYIINIPLRNMGVNKTTVDVIIYEHFCCIFKTFTSA